MLEKFPDLIPTGNDGSMKSRPGWCRYRGAMPPDLPFPRSDGQLNWLSLRKETEPYNRLQIPGWPVAGNDKTDSTLLRHSRQWQMPAEGQALGIVHLDVEDSGNGGRDPLAVDDEREREEQEGQQDRMSGT